MEFFGALAALSSSFAIEAVGIEAADPSILAEQFLISTLFPILLNSKQLFSAFIDRLPGYAWIKNVDGSYVYINERLRQLPPYQSDCVGKTDEDLWPPELAALYRANDLKVIATREKVEAVEWFVLNGKEYHQRVSKFPIFNADGMVIMVGGTSVDITEQKRVEEALRETESLQRTIIESGPECVKLVASGAEEALVAAERKYRDIFENAMEGIFQTTPDGRFIAANPALVKMLGYDSPEQLIRERADISNQHYVDPIRREELKRQLEEQGVVKAFELQVYRKDGSAIWLSENVRAVRDEGRLLYYEGTTQDITERRQADHSLRLFRALIDRSTDAIEVIDPDTLRFLDCNKSAHQDLGYSRKEFLKLSVYDTSPLADVRTTTRLAEEMNRVGFVTFESVHRRKDGSTFPVEVNLKTVHLERDYRLAVVRDITERKVTEEALREDMIARKRADQALRKAEQKYRELFENAKDATYVHDLSGRYTSLNRAAEKLTGYSREEILGEDFSSFVAPEYLDKVRENLSTKLRQQGETSYEVEVVTKDGRRVPVEVSSRLIYEEGVPVGVQGTARDIVERKRAEEALRGYSRQLIRAQEAERQSIARELHDQIGQVLTAIRINLKTLRNSANRAESNALIDEGVTIVDEAIQQVRDLSFELRPSLLDDLGLTAALRWYADRFMQRTGIHTKTSICPESRNRLPRELETACFRIVQEALTNVARHAQARNAFVDVRTLNGAISLSIKDDGIGFNLHSQANGELPGSLGVRGMEERAGGLGGTLEINSAPHKGTEVTVHFPNGSTYLSPGISRHVISQYMDRTTGRRSVEALTPRQREILQMIAEGKNTKQIALILNVSVKTVESHRAQLMKRLGATDISGLVRHALRLKLLKL